ncbi:ABC transporter substrate-binding protein [Frigidibacter sp. ROC022]|uniref:ABC transporter substrate-binding protein n=1 Tax=Frigidibacter sp. ROC022 TaxID=2971796 RepID=UPI00215A3E9E|nr:ABC transporter substrate-binding protein [Frigidibacter sp. ROC022]MCR8724398.1 ABC transporter substrate-binding protein [Frigidibacter sp. ROC022]
MTKHRFAALLASTFLASAATAATLDIAVDTAPAGLDPHLITAFNSVLIVQGNIYQGLTDIDPGLAVQPGLATSWDISEDGLTYTFHLASGVTFHDGSTFDAEDAAASLRRVQSPETASPLASRISPVVGIEVVDPLTLKLTLDAPFAPLLSSLAGIAMVPAEMETDKEALQMAPDGTGPFKFADWTPNGYIALEAFDGYRDGKPQIDEVKFHFVPEAATRQIGLVSGEYDMLPAVDPATALQLQGQPGVTLEQTRDLAYTLIGMNVTDPALADPKVREAVNLLLNRDEIIAGALFGAGVPAGPLSPALTEWALPTSDFSCYTPDVDKAKALIAESGVALPIKLRMVVLPRQDAKDIAQIAQQQLAAGGIEVELINQEIGDFVQSWKNSDFGMFVSANGGNPDPDQYFYRTFYTGGSTNVFKYSDARVDDLLDTGRNKTDMAERKAAYDELQVKLACEGPIAHIAYANLTTAVGPKLHGFVIHPMGRLSSLKDAVLDD